MLPIMPALLLATQAFLTGMANAQTPPPVTPQSASLPTYQSALDGYQPFGDEKLAPWKESNDNVGRIGGWRAYAREASDGNVGPSAAPAGAASAARTPASAGRPPATTPSAPASGAKPAPVATPAPAAAPPAPAARPSGSHGRH